VILRKSCKAVIRALIFLFLGTCVFAQQSAPPVTIPSTGFAGLDKYRASRIAVYTDDYGQLARYRDVNAALKPPAPAENRVVFFGDSITDIWHLDESFPGKPYVNRGIGGQTTSQMLVRFRQDVINLQPKVVVILAGTNDIAGNSGPISNEDIEANLTSLAELARANKVAVIFSSVLPVHNYTPQSQDFYAQRPMERILALNHWLKDYCGAKNLVYLDYFSAVVDDKGLLKRDLADDGLHPNKAGFGLMAPLADKAIETALHNPVAENDPISIELKHNSDRERRTEEQLQHLLKAYGLRKYTFTRRVLIDERSIPHSHPVLTLHTRHLNSDDQLLSTYVHEQIHWFLEQHLERTQAAENDLRKIYTKVPVGFPDGSDDEEGTHLHLITCYLEMLADRDLMGAERTVTVMNFWAGDHYCWVYKPVMQDEGTIRGVVEREKTGNRVGLSAILLPANLNQRRARLHL
jgi:acyl-CoA thioesterase I